MEKELFSTALGIEEPVYIDKIMFDGVEGELHIHMNFSHGGRFSCSGCITFDKFHVIQALNKAQDEVRRMEHKNNPLLTG